MNQKNFKLIQGGKPDHEPYDKRQLPGMAGMALSRGEALKKSTWLGARATNTRLMGVVGLVVVTEKPEGGLLTHIFHLDFEGYGIDGYGVFDTSNELLITREITRVAGGLGGTFVDLSEKEAKALIYEAYLQDPDSVHVHYDILPEFPELIEPIAFDDKAYFALTDKVGPKPLTDLELIHYAVMRLSGQDYKSFRYLSDAPLPTAFEREIDSPATLLKHTLSEGEASHVEGVKGLKVYSSEALIDHMDRYKLLRMTFQTAETTRGRKIVGIILEGSMSISAYEASFQLRKREHIAVYEMLDHELLEDFIEVHPEMLVNEHGAGVLLTAFNEDNAHVNRSVYYLSGDVYANYYLTDEDQMIVSSFELETLDEIDQKLMERYPRGLMKIGEMTADQSILYEFVNSGYGNLYEFLEDTQS